MAEKHTRNKPNVLVQGDSFLLSLANYFMSDNYISYDAFFNKKQHRLNADHISYRVISHWEKVGVITTDRPSGTGWRMYSFIELVWISVVSELRKFNYPLEKIKAVKGNFKNLYGEFNTEYAPVEFYAAHVLTFKVPAFILVFQDGKVQVGTNHERTGGLMLNLLDNHLSISLNDILEKLLPTSDLSPIYEKLVSLSNEETEAIFMLRTGNFDSVTIKKTDGRIQRIEASELVNLKRQISDILQDSAYQTIEILQRDGQTRSIRRKTVKKFF